MSAVQVQVFLCGSGTFCWDPEVTVLLLMTEWKSPVFQRNLQNENLQTWSCWQYWILQPMCFWRWIGWLTVTIVTTAASFLTASTSGLRNILMSNEHNLLASLSVYYKCVWSENNLFAPGIWAKSINYWNNRLDNCMRLYATCRGFIIRTRTKTVSFLKPLLLPVPFHKNTSTHCHRDFCKCKVVESPNLLS